MGKFRLRGRRRRNREPRPDRIPLRAIVPNLVTSLAACAGITSISLSSEGRFFEALFALLIACICDGMDGRIARLLKASSKLGAELDSLADFVNFGVAPAMFMYFWTTGGPTHANGSINPTVIRFVLGAALYYAMCDCFRLARFNTMLEQETAPYWTNYFTGVPAPGGCWLVLSPAMTAMALGELKLLPQLVNVIRSPWFGVVMLLAVGSLMASRLPTLSLKHLHISRKALPFVLAFILLLIALFVVNFWLWLGLLGGVYLLSIPVSGLFFLRSRSRYEKNLPNNS